jgi:hypothetical protein
MLKDRQKTKFAKLRLNKKALAIPVTFMILFVSMLGVISITYYLAVEKVNTRSTTLKVATAKQDMLSLDDAVMQVLGQPGSARTFEFEDSGGQLNVQPDVNNLSINVTDGGEIEATVFNEITGQVSYELPYSGSPDTGLFLKGDSRSIVSQSGSVMTQLYIARGVTHPEIRLQYRPTVSYTTAGTENGKTVNNIRVYILNLNTSDVIALYGKLPLKISCVTTQITTTTFDVSYEPESLTITAGLDAATGQVTIPVSSTSSGAIINVETVLCNVRIQRGLM